MIDSKIIRLKGIGPVRFVKSRRAKRINITVKPSEDVRVSVPTRMSFDMAVETARIHSEWIKKQLRRMRRLNRKHAHLNELAPDISREYARRRLTSRLEALAEHHGFTYNKVFIRDQKTRWGSCSGKNNINLNRKLVLLPVELRDYVLLHELVHTRIKNHSRKFWLELERLAGDAKAKQKRLREYGLTFM